MGIGQGTVQIAGSLGFQIELSRQANDQPAKISQPRPASSARPDGPASKAAMSPVTPPLRPEKLEQEICGLPGAQRLPGLFAVISAPSVPARYTHVPTLIQPWNFYMSGRRDVVLR